MKHHPTLPNAVDSLHYEHEDWTCPAYVDGPMDAAGSFWVCNNPLPCSQHTKGEADG